MHCVEKTVLVDGLTESGYGYSSKIEIPKSLPGEELRIEVRKERGKILSILKPSPMRVEPRCTHFPICGGCKIQEMEPLAQSRWKEEKVRKHFPECSTILAPPQSYEWRNKMEFSFSEDKAQNRYLGLIMQDSKGKVFNVERCHLASPWMSGILAPVRTWWEETGLRAYKHNQNTGTLRSLFLREGMTTGDRMAMLHVSGNPEDALTQNQMQSFKEVCLKWTPEGGNLAVFILIQLAMKGQKTQFFEIHLSGRDMIREELGGKLFLISPRSFFQPNTLQAGVLYQKGIDLLDLQGDETVYDLYCGTGTLGIFASAQAKQVIGVEISKEACLDANQNVAINKIENVRIVNGDVGKVLSGDFPPADVVMVDPPRAGLSDGAIQHILRLNPKKILYISCHLESLAKNVLNFTQFGYNISAVQPVDQFPHTYHVETLVYLKKEF